MKPIESEVIKIPAAVFYQFTDVFIVLSFFFLFIIFFIIFFWPFFGFIDRRAGDR